MSSVNIPNLKWFKDSAVPENEPGLRHSFAASLATAINHLDGNLDPVWLMGVSGFAFRINVNEIMCPSAMSVFDWTEVLPEAVEQLGHDCYYISRLWHEEELEQERRKQAHQLITTSLKNNTPAIVWDVADAEWGLISGFDDESEKYLATAGNGNEGTLPYTKLGRNGINVLSVTIPGELNNRDHDEIIRNTLFAAIKHAEQGEWNERPKYQEGLPAYDQWAVIFDRWMMLLLAGNIDNIGVDICGFARYYSEHYYSARRYARDFLNSIAGRHEILGKAHQSYSTVTDHLKIVWKQSPENTNPEIELLKSNIDHIKKAKRAETEGISYLKEYLNLTGGGSRASISLE